MTGNPKKTKKFDYRAADGMWYPSNKLESYFKKSPNYTFVEFLKEMYSTTVLSDLIYKDNPLLASVSKTQSFSGANIPVSLGEDESK